jgi:hypothetical protein
MGFELGYCFENAPYEPLQAMVNVEIRFQMARHAKSLKVYVASPF